MSGNATPVPSPCIGRCRIDDATGWCRGCLRTLDEIARWQALGETDKLAVWQQLDGRRAEARARGLVVPPAAPWRPVF